MAPQRHLVVNDDDDDDNLQLQYPISGRGLLVVNILYSFRVEKLKFLPFLVGIPVIVV